MNTDILFYGAAWCSDCRRSRAYLDGRGISYSYVDLEKDPEAAAEVMRLNNGLQSIPTIVFPDGAVLVEPSDSQLEATIKQQKIGPCLSSTQFSRPLD